MTAFIVTAAALAVLAAALLSRPLWTRDVDAPLVEDDVRTFATQVAQLGALHRAGALTDDQYAQSKAAVEDRLRARLADLGQTVVHQGRPSQRLGWAVALFLPLFAAAGYAWLGSPTSLTLGPGSGASTMGRAAGEGTSDAAAQAPHALAPEQVAIMVDQLAKRMKDRPDDAEGWLMLARSLVVLGKHTESIDAFKQATRLHPEDAGALADYADALAVARGKTLQGEPARLVEQALAVDPTNTKALALAGTAAFDRKDYAGAVRHWEKLVQVAPDDAFTQQIRSGIVEARELGGMAPATAPPREDKAGVDRPASVAGTVSLAPSLQGRAAPDDTVFVFARRTDGSRMPLAILRKQVRDLPLHFTLDDSLAMSPSAKLSGADRVIVGARVSKSGNAMPQAGDLQGTLGAISVGAADLRIEIDQQITK